MAGIFWWMLNEVVQSPVGIQEDLVVVEAREGLGSTLRNRGKHPNVRMPIWIEEILILTVTRIRDPGPHLDPITLGVRTDGISETVGIAVEDLRSIIISQFT